MGLELGLGLGLGLGGWGVGGRLACGAVISRAELDEPWEG